MIIKSGIIMDQFMDGMTKENAAEENIGQLKII